MFEHGFRVRAAMSNGEVWIGSVHKPEPEIPSWLILLDAYPVDTDRPAQTVWLGRTHIVSIHRV